VYKLIKVCALIILSYSIESKELPAAGVVVLKPEVRVEPKSKALYTIPSDDLITYFNNIVLFDTMDEYDNLPYIFGFNKDKNMGGNGDAAFALGFNADDNISALSMIKYKKKYIDPVTGKLIGFKADVIGDAEVMQLGVPTTLLITDITTSIDSGTKLIPRTGLDLPLTISVKNPDIAMSGYVLETEAEGVGSGTYTVLAINLGQKDGLQQGNILYLMEKPRSVLDPYTNKKVQMPIVKFGEVIVYKVGDKISLAIISSADRPVLPTDHVVATGLGS